MSSIESFRDIETLRRTAEDGDPNAQYALACRYGNGDDVSLDYVQSARWLKAAAARNHLPAIRMLAWLYASGYGVDQDDKQAGKWYLKAAEHGSPQDQYFAGTLYSTGRYGMPRDVQRMLYWYQKAANQLYGPALYALGQVALQGKKVERDERAAFEYLSLAVARGHERAKKALEELTNSMPADRLAAYKSEMLERMKSQQATE